MSYPDSSFLGSKPQVTPSAWGNRQPATKQSQEPPKYFPELSSLSNSSLSPGGNKQWSSGSSSVVSKGSTRNQKTNNNTENGKVEKVEGGVVEPSVISAPSQSQVVGSRQILQKKPTAVATPLPTTSTSASTSANVEPPPTQSSQGPQPIAMAAMALNPFGMRQLSSERRTVPLTLSSSLTTTTSSPPSSSSTALGYSHQQPSAFLSGGNTVSQLNSQEGRFVHSSQGGGAQTRRQLAIFPTKTAEADAIAVPVIPPNAMPQKAVFPGQCNSPTKGGPKMEEKEDEKEKAKQRRKEEEEGRNSFLVIDDDDDDEREGNNYYYNQNFGGGNTPPPPPVYPGIGLIGTGSIWAAAEGSPSLQQYNTPEGDPNTDATLWSSSSATTVSVGGSGSNPQQFVSLPGAFYSNNAIGGNQASPPQSTPSHFFSHNPSTTDPTTTLNNSMGLKRPDDSLLSGETTRRQPQQFRTNATQPATTTSPLNLWDAVVQQHMETQRQMQQDQAVYQRQNGYYREVLRQNQQHPQSVPSQVEDGSFHPLLGSPGGFGAFGAPSEGGGGVGGGMYMPSHNAMFQMAMQQQSQQNAIHIQSRQMDHEFTQSQGRGHTSSMQGAGTASPEEKQARIARMSTSMRALRDRIIASGVPIPQDVKLVDSVAESAKICEMIMNEEKVIGLDLEGVDLGRTGRISIATVATSKCTYLFDVTTLDKSVFTDGKLRSILTEDSNIVKLLFDCRADQDAMYYLYNVKIAPVCDLQVMAVDRFAPNGHRVIGMKTAFNLMQLFSTSDTETKEKGGIYFTPEKGGSYEVWEHRPLSTLLVEYCAVDVKYFFVAQHILKNFEKRGFEIGKARIEHVISSVDPLPSNAERDFV